MTGDPDKSQPIDPKNLPKPAGIPDEWIEKPTDEPGGKQYVNPENPNDRVRVMPGNPDSPYPTLEAHNSDLALLKLTLSNKGGKGCYIETSDHAVRELLAKIFEHVHQPLPGNFQLMPDFRIFEGNNLYLVKPMQLRYWLSAASLADADAIALDLQNYAGYSKKKSRA